MRGWKAEREVPRRMLERRRGSVRLCRTGRLPRDRAAMRVLGKHKAMPPTAGGRPRASGRTGRITRRPRTHGVRPTIVRNRVSVQIVQPMGQPRTRRAFATIVHPGQATAVRAAATLRGLRRLAKTATARITPTAGALTNRRNGVTAGRRQTGTAVTPSSLLIRRGPIPHRAAAIRHRLVPPLHLAAATATAGEAATVATVAVMGEAEALAATVVAVGVTTAAVVAAVVTTAAVAAVAAITVEAGAGAPTAVAVVAADRIDNPSFWPCEPVRKFRAGFLLFKTACSFLLTLSSRIGTRTLCEPRPMVRLQLFFRRGVELTRAARIPLFPYSTKGGWRNESLKKRSARLEVNSNHWPRWNSSRCDRNGGRPRQNE